MNRSPRKTRSGCLAAASLLVAGFAAQPGSGAQATAEAVAPRAASRPIATPSLEARVKPILDIDGVRFRDLNANGALDRYEDWRLPVEQRVDDLARRMTLAEKAGLMLIDTLNAGCEGAVTPKAFDYVTVQRMHRFILRNVVGPTPTCGPDGGFRAGSVVTPVQAAEFANAMQALGEGTRLGIPVMFKSNGRNHLEPDARAGISEASGAFTAFPKEAGLAAAALGAGYAKTGRVRAADMEPIRQFARTMGAEWRAIGLRGMYGYGADLATEPRWYRVPETFSENADLVADISRTLVETLQGGALSPASDVALTMKHFPGGGPQDGGLDPHYSFGREQVYPAGRFADHLKPFQAAIDAGVAAIMPYYGVPVGLTHDGVKYDAVGMAFSPTIVDGLLRGKLGFTGYVNSDTGIVTDRAWGLDERSVPERIAATVNAGTDLLSGFHDVATLLSLVDAKLVTEERIDMSARRLLVELFRLGLFENPYVDAKRAASVLGSEAHQALALQLQRSSIVLLQNQPRARGESLVLPLRAGSRLYVLGMPATEATRRGFTTIDGATPPGGTRASAAGADFALIRVTVRNEGAQAYRSNDPATGQNPAHRDPVTDRPWGSRDACVVRNAPPCVDDSLLFGGALPWEVGELSFSAMARSKSWKLSPSLEDIRAVMREAGASRTVIAIDFRQPYVLDDESGVRDAGALIATFGVGDRALLDVLDGTFAPQGRLPYALPGSLEAVRANAPDAPGYAKRDTLFPYGFGLTYR